MRFLSFIILMVLPYAAFAQESPPATTPVPGTTQPAEKPSVSLDALFSDLRTETNRASGRRIAQEIRSQWSRSGSATVDLLMIWAADAMQAEKNILAEDLLTQSIVLMPN
jgi:hypothetical protein